MGCVHPSPRSARGNLARFRPSFSLTLCAAFAVNDPLLTFFSSSPHSLDILFLNMSLALLSSFSALLYCILACVGVRGFACSPPFVPFFSFRAIPAQKSKGKRAQYHPYTHPLALSVWPPLVPAHSPLSLSLTDKLECVNVRWSCDSLSWVDVPVCGCVCERVLAFFLAAANSFTCFFFFHFRKICVLFLCLAALLCPTKRATRVLA